MRREDLDLAQPPANLLEDARRNARREWAHAALRRLFDHLPHPVSLRRTDGGQPVITEQRLGAEGAARHYVGHSTLVQGGLPDMICSVWTDIEDQVAQIRALRGALEARRAARGGLPRLQPPARAADAVD